MRTPLLLTAVLAFTGVLSLSSASAAAQKGFASKNTYLTANGTTSGENPTTTLHGRVQGTKGLLPGAIVKLLATNERAVTNASGEFNLKVAASGPQQVLVSYAGYADQIMLLQPGEELSTLELTQPQSIRLKRSQRLKAYLRTARREARRESRRIARHA